MTRHTTCAGDRVFTSPVHIEWSTLSNHSTALIAGAHSGRAGLVCLNRILRSFKFALLQVAVSEGLEQNREENKASVGPPDDFPRETIKEADIVADNRGRTGLLAVGATTILHVWVPPQSVVHRCLARDRL